MGHYADISDRHGLKENRVPRFRKKPVVIEAVQWTTDKNFHDVPEWLSHAIQTALDAYPQPVGTVMRHADNLLIQTLEGTMTASPGDWIIRGVNGELYSCKPDIFAATYETAE